MCGKEKTRIAIELKQQIIFSYYFSFGHFIFLILFGRSTILLLIVLLVRTRCVDQHTAIAHTQESLNKKNKKTTHTFDAGIWFTCMLFRSEHSEKLIIIVYWIVFFVWILHSRVARLRLYARINTTHTHTQKRFRTMRLNRMLMTQARASSQCIRWIREPTNSSDHFISLSAFLIWFYLLLRFLVRCLPKNSRMESVTFSQFTIQGRNIQLQITSNKMGIEFV